jgi:hypothetical protein
MIKELTDDNNNKKKNVFDLDEYSNLFVDNNNQQENSIISTV